MENTYLVKLDGNDSWTWQGYVKADNAVEAVRVAYEKTQGLTIENVIICSVMAIEKL